MIRIHTNVEAPECDWVLEFDAHGARWVVGVDVSGGWWVQAWRDAVCDEVGGPFSWPSCARDVEVEVRRGEQLSLF